MSGTERADALVVLGCRVRGSGEPSGALDRRLRMAAMGYAEGLAPRVVASGGQSWNGHIEALVMKRELLRHGVPERAISVELASLSTRTNAWFCARLLDELGAQRVVVVSCAWHLPRALALFRRQGLTALAPPPQWFAAVSAPPAGRWLRVREALWRQLDTALLARLAPRRRGWW